MGRWSQYAEDEYRLPDGMARVGYDADTEIYTYRDADGSYWEGVPGAQYGVLKRVQASTFDEGTSTEVSDLKLVHAGSQEKASGATDAGFRSASSWSFLSMVLLLVCLVLIFVVQWLRGGTASENPSAKTDVCSGQGEHLHAITVRGKDTCWEIAHQYDMSVEQLVRVNPGIDCNLLQIGTQICVKNIA